MKTEVVTRTIPATTTVESIELSLSVEEFALLYVLDYRYTGGDNPLRDSFQEGIQFAFSSLPPEVREKITDLCWRRCSNSFGDWNSDQVLEAFS